MGPVVVGRYGSPSTGGVAKTLKKGRLNQPREGAGDPERGSAFVELFILPQKRLMNSKE